MADPLLGPRCTRRKQANPRRKNVELEDMPEEVDLDHLGPNDAVAAAASMKETPPTVVTEAATTSTHHRTPVDHRPKTHVSPTTRRPDDSENFGDVEDDCRAGDDDDDDDNSSHCASKDACSVNSVTSERRRTMMVVPSSPPNSPSGAHPVPKLHAALVAPGDGSGGAGGQPPTQPTLLTPSAAESHEDEDDKSEEEKIQEYLRRSDTAVIYPEPVDGDPSSNAHTSSPAPAVAGNNNNNTDHKGSLEISRTPTIKDEFYLKCPHCDQVYPNVDSLRVHLVTQHGATESAAIASVAAGGTGGYSCDKCSATFAQKGQLEKHEDLHSPTAQVVACKVCNKTFANVYRLQRHMISHDESAVLRKFKCPECEKAFKFKHHLKEHIRIHSGEKPFACPNCGKRFSHSGSYSSHMTSKKCLVMNLKVRRTIDKPNMRGNGVASAGVMACHGGVGGGGGGGGRRGSSQGAFTPILPKYGENGLELSPSFSTPSGLSMSDHYAAALDFVPSSMQAFLPPPYGLHPLLTGNHHHHPHFTNSGLSAFAGLAGPPPPLASLSHMIRPSAIAVKTMLDDVQDTCFVQQRDSAVAPSLSSPHSEAEEAVRTFGPLSPGVPNPCGDLKAVKKILATVNATVSKQQEMGKLRNGLSVPNHQDGTRVTSTPSPTTSRTESPLTTTTAVSSPRSPTLSASVDNAMKRNGLRGDDSHCRHCGDFFESKIDLHQHERYICKMNRENFPVSKEDTASLVNDFTPSSGDKGSHTSMNGFSDMDDDPLMSDADDCNRDIGDDSMMMLAGDGRKVRMRSLFSEEHQAVLRSYYETNARPAKEDLQRIAAEIKFPPRVVQVWFQNMRARDKKRGRTRDGNQLSRSFCSDDVSLPPLQQQQPIQHASTPFSAISPPSTYGGSAFNGGVMTSRLPHMPIFYPTPSPSPFSLPTAPLRLNGHCLSSSSSSPPAPPSFVAPQFPLDHEQPLDLSVKGGQKTGHQRCQNSCHSPAASDHSGASDGEALNLSQKSSRTSTPSKESNNHNNNSYAMVTTSVAHNGVQLNDTAALMKSAESNNIFKYMMTTPKMEMEELSAGEDTPDLVVVRRGFSGSPTTCDTPRLHRILASSPHLDISSLNGMVDSSGRVYSTDGSHSPCPSDHDDQLEIDEGSNHHRRCWKQMGHGDDCHLDMDDSSLGEDDRPLKRRKSWKQHKLDAEEGMYACDQCDKVFSKQSSLARHKYEHSGQRPHKCDVCAKAFKHKHHLTEHKRLHSGEKPFQCKKCLKRFSHSGSYSQHMNHRYSYCKPYRE